MAYSEVTTPDIYFRDKGTLLEDGIVTVLHDFPVFRELYVNRSGSSVPGHKTLIKRKQDATSDYTITGQRLIKRKGGVFSERTTWDVPGEPHREIVTTRDYEIAPSIGMDWSSAGISFSALKNKALEKFYTRLKDQLNRFEGGKFLGESNQTKRMLGDRLGQLGAGVDGMRRQMEREYRYMRYVSRIPYARAIKRISGLYLEYTFGWSPLISDIQEIGAVLDNRSRAFNFRVRSSSATTISSPDVVDVYGTTGGFYTVRASLKSTYRWGFVACVNGELDLAQRWGVSWQDVPSILWEVTPWSFLVDYFVNISAFLDAYQYFNTVPVYASDNTLIRREYNFSSRCNTVSSGTPEVKTVVLLNDPALTRVDTYYFRRLKRTALPFYVPPVKFLDALSPKRLCNIAALAGQRFPSY